MSLDFEDLCLDPYQDHFDIGRREGSAAGLQAGYDEGRKLGQQKAVEVGIELGYMRGVAEAIRQDVLSSVDAANVSSLDDNTLRGDEGADATRRKMEKKIGKSLNELLSMIDAFPSPDEIFHQSTTRGDDQAISSDGGLDGEEDDSEQLETQSGGPVDISGRMQRIRAKFKLLCVHLKIPEAGLSKVMEDAKKDLGKSTTNENVTARSYTSEQVKPGGDQDW